MPLRVIVLRDAVDAIASEVARAGQNETGGLLLGWRRSDLDLWAVARATGPGPGAIVSPTRLRLDTLHLQKEVDRSFAETNGEVSYLGDWHLHHENDPTPSGKDRLSIEELVERPEIAVVRPLLIIVATGTYLRWRGWVGARFLPAEIEFAPDLLTGEPDRTRSECEGTPSGLAEQP
jgi:integrative and conjugative element protein (TIGR02256 family)